jgi:hypothetical protein
MKYIRFCSPINQQGVVAEWLMRMTRTIKPLVIIFLRERRFESCLRRLFLAI